MRAETNRVNRLRSLLVILAVVLAISGCRFGNPVSIDDPPLAERMEDRRSEAVRVAEEVAAELEADAEPPAQLAFDAQAQFAQPIVAQLLDAPLGAKLRSGPGSGYDELRVIPADGMVETTGNLTGEWVQVRYGDLEGWMRIIFLTPTISDDGELIEADPEPTPVPGTTYLVAGTEVGVNLRDEPIVGELVSGAPIGSIVTGTGNTDGQWIEVVFNDVTGWAFGGYLEPTE
jgi:hypothetical protein